MQERHKDRARIVLWFIWTAGALWLFYLALVHIGSTSGSGPTLALPNGEFVWLMPISAIVAALATILGVVAIAVEGRRLKSRATHRPS